MVEVAARGLQDEVDLLGEGPRLEGRLVDRGVCGVHEGVLVPGDRERHPAVAGVGHHDGARRLTL